VTRTRPVDAAIYATLAAFVLGDLLPGPTALGAVAVGIAGGIAALSHRDVARMLLSISIGMLLGITGVVLLAFAHH
jgi:hypothetical protein